MDNLYEWTFEVQSKGRYAERFAPNGVTGVIVAGSRDEFGQEFRRMYPPASGGDISYGWILSGVKALPLEVSRLQTEIEALRGLIESTEANAALSQQRARDAEVRADERARVLAEFTEWFAPAFTASGGHVSLIGHEVLDRDYATKEAIRMSSPDDLTPTYVARRLVGPWRPETVGDDA